MSSHHPRLIVVGVDGASHDLISRWSAAGKLPILSGLASSDRQTALTTAFPPHTAPGWASIFSGVDPGEHGIYQFWELQARDYRPALMTVGDFGREPLWRILERHGLSIGLYNVPMTHPPEPINGFMVTWPLTPTLGYAFPRTLVGELMQRGLHYKSDLVTMYRDDRDYISVAQDQIESKTDTLLYLMQSHPVDVLFAVYTELDRVSHYYWGSGELPESQVEEIYRAMDRALGRLLEAIPSDVPVLIVSDHGFGLCRANLNVNVLLAQAGLLKYRNIDTPDPAGHQRPAGFFSDADHALSAGWFSSADGTRTVDWSRTRAFMPAPGCFGINFNLCGRQRDGMVAEERERDAIARDIADAVQSVRMDDQAVFTVLRREDLYRGHRLDEAPDLILSPRRWDVMPAPSLAEALWGTPTQTGIHREDGIFFSRNFGMIPASVKPRVADVVPTCLARLGLPVPEELDGRNLAGGGRAPDSEPARRISRAALRSRDLAGQVQVEKRLAQLGYL